VFGGAESREKEYYGVRDCKQIKRRISDFNFDGKFCLSSRVGKINL
jgi:hypothetical protein